MIFWSNKLKNRKIIFLETQISFLVELWPSATRFHSKKTLEFRKICLSTCRTIFPKNTIQCTNSNIFIFWGFLLQISCRKTRQNKATGGWYCAKISKKYTQGCVSVSYPPMRDIRMCQSRDISERIRWDASVPRAGNGLRKRIRVPFAGTIARINTMA